jgi:hypothetical protein
MQQGFFIGFTENHELAKMRLEGQAISRIMPAIPRSVARVLLPGSEQVRTTLTLLTVPGTGYG